MNSALQTAVWLENGVFSLKQIPIDEGDESKNAVVRVKRVGICSTDHQLQLGYYPFTGVPGHEFVGIVEKCKDKTLIGKTVVADINVVCNKCSYCQSGHPHHCSERRVVGIINSQGAMAQFISLPSSNLIPVPDGTPDKDACFAEPLAAALEIQEQVNIAPGARVLVIGDGKLGLLVVHSLAMKRQDIQIDVAGRHAAKLSLVSQYRNVRTSIDRSFFVPNTYNVVVECTGNSASFDDAVSTVRPRGAIVLKSTYAGELVTKISQVVVKELTIVGSRCGPLKKAVDMLAAHHDAMNLSSMVTAEYPLEQALQAIEHSKQHGVLKVQIVVNNEEKK